MCRQHCGMRDKSQPREVGSTPTRYTIYGQRVRRRMFNILFITSCTAIHDGSQSLSCEIELNRHRDWHNTKHSQGSTRDMVLSDVTIRLMDLVVRIAVSQCSQLTTYTMKVVKTSPCRLWLKAGALRWDTYRGQCHGVRINNRCSPCRKIEKCFVFVY